MTQARPYAGVEASDRLATRRDRLLRAGLQLLGGTVDPPELTVRGICAEAGLATRYFYESFADKEEFIAAVFDWVVATLAGSTQAAVAAAPAMEQTRAGMSTIVLSIESDPRIGRLMFNSRLSNATVMRTPPQLQRRRIAAWLVLLLALTAVAAAALRVWLESP